MNQYGCCSYANWKGSPILAHAHLHRHNSMSLLIVCVLLLFCVLLLMFGIVFCIWHMRTNDDLTAYNDTSNSLYWRAAVTKPNIFFWYFDIPLETPLVYLLPFCIWYFYIGVNEDAVRLSSVEFRYTNTTCPIKSCGYIYTYIYMGNNWNFGFLLRQMRAQKFILKICIENEMTISLSDAGNKNRALTLLVCVWFSA